MILTAKLRITTGEIHTPVIMINKMTIVMVMIMIIVRMTRVKFMIVGVVSMQLTVNVNVVRCR